MICRSTSSSSLYWLPSRDSAWANLSAAELDRVYPCGHRFEATILYRNQRPCSISATDAGQAELREYAAGKQMVVTVVGRREVSDAANSTQYLVRSRTSKIVFVCEVYKHDGLKAGEDVRVEVVRRIWGSLCL